MAQEFSIQLEEEIQRGLRPRQKIVRNQTWLTEAFNVVAASEGLIAYSPLSDPFEGGETISFPFPQLFRGFEEFLLASETSLKTVDDSGSPWTASGVTLYDPRDPTTTDTISSGGGIWHYADLGKSWWLVNEGNIIFKTSLGSLVGNVFSSEKTFIEKGVGLQTICEHKGRVFCTGFSNMWDSRWTEILESIRGDMSGDINPLFQTFPENYVLWSSPGGYDFPLWLMFPVGSTSFRLEPDRRALISSLEQGLWGVQPATFKGAIKVVKALGTSVIVYGEDGITRMRMSGHTYSREHIADFGIANRGSVGGSDQEHFFISESGELWSLKGEGLPERLGYSEFLSSFTGSTHLISHSQEREETFISKSDKSYVVGTKGLTECFQRVISSFGISDDSTDSEARIVTTDLDMKLRGIKTITQVHLGGDFASGDNLQVAVDYRFNRNDSYSRTGFFPVNKEGTSSPLCAGTDFRIVVKGSDYSDFHLDYIQVMFQVVDKRYRRGPSASQTSQLNI